MLGTLFFVRLASAALACPGKVCVDIQALGSVYQFNISGPPQAGYMAIGVGSSMTSADMYIAYFDEGGNPVVSHRAASSYDAPATLQSNINITGSDPKLQCIVFNLALPQPQASAVLNTKASNSMIWAYSDKKPSSSGSIIKHSNEGTFFYSFQSAKAAVPGIPSYFIWHGALMLVAWLIFPSLAIFTARFLKDKLGPRWLTVHQLLFFLTAVVSIISISFVACNLGNVLSGPHAKTGVITMVLFGIQMILGVVIDKLWHPGRKSVPWHDNVHWWLGRLIFLLAIANIFFGIVLLGNPVGFWVPTAIILFAIPLLFIYGQVKIGKITH